MPTAISMLDFLRTGNLGPIHVGISDEAVTALLGQPEDTARFRIGKRHHGHIWKYGDLELTIRDHVLTMIHMEPSPFHDVALRLPMPLQFEGLELSRRLKLEAFMGYLKSHELAYTWDPMLTFDTQTCLFVEDRVKVVFDREERLAALTQSCSNEKNHAW